MKSQCPNTLFGAILWLLWNPRLSYATGSYGYGNPYNAITGYKPLHELLEKMFEGYERRVRPFHKSSAVEIHLSTYIIDLLYVDEVNMEFTLDMYFREYWVDPRLTFIPKPNIGHTIHLEPEYIKKVWLPDTFIVNERKSMFHEGTISHEWIRVKSDGEIRKSDRRTITAFCPMTFYYYPFDRHVCSMEFESFSSNMEDMQYDWHGGTISPAAISVNATNGTIVPFKVTNLEAKRFSVELPSGNFSRLSVDITMQKYWGVFLSKYYIPLFLFVVVSLVTLWIRHAKFSFFLNIVNLIFAHIFLVIPDTGAIVPYTEYWKAPNVYLLITLLYLYVSFLGKGGIQLSNAFLCLLFLVSLAVHICNKYEIQSYDYKEPKTYIKIAKELHPDDKLKKENKFEDSLDRSQRPPSSSRGTISTQTYFATAISKILRICRITKWTLDISFVVVNLIFWILIIVLSESWRIPADLIMVDHDFK